VSEDFFPFTVYGGEHARVAPDFRAAFHRVRPEGFSWYCADVEVLSPVDVVFVVYDMRSMASGGRGREIARWPAGLGDPAVSRQAMARRAISLGAEQLVLEQLAAERRTTAGYANAILERAYGTLPGPSPTRVCPLCLRTTDAHDPGCQA
jgi:hypothetical protein